MEMIEQHQLGHIFQAGLSNGSVVVLVVPAEHARALFMPAQVAAPMQTEFQPDIDLETYIAKYEPTVSLSTVRQRCADGWFPDTFQQDGNLVPGAYRNRNGHWRVTVAGIMAAQRLDREAHRTRTSPRCTADHTGLEAAKHMIRDSAECAGIAPSQCVADEPAAAGGEFAQASDYAAARQDNVPTSRRKRRRTGSPAPVASRAQPSKNDEREWRKIRRMRN